MEKRMTVTGVLLSALMVAPGVQAEPLIWGVQVEQLEYRVGEHSDVLAWDFDALVGTDELKFVWRSEGEFATEEDKFETLENQARLQTPISSFFDAVVGVRVDTPDGPDRVYGVLGLHGLAQQWFEIDVDFFVSEDPIFRLEAEYEGLITNRVILTPSVQIDLPFTDDTEIGNGAWGPKIEVGARLSYDLVDRAVAPYVGVHYERAFGKTSQLTQSAGEDPGAVFFVAGVRLMF